jgi:hypothetical protein
MTYPGPWPLALWGYGDWGDLQRPQRAAGRPLQGGVAKAFDFPPSFRGHTFRGARQGGSNYIPTQRAAGSASPQRSAGSYAERSISAFAGSRFAWGLRTPKMQNLTDNGRGLQIYRSRKGGSDMTLLAPDPRSSVTQDETDQGEDRNRSLAEARGGWQSELPASPAPILTFPEPTQTSPPTTFCRQRAARTPFSDCSSGLHRRRVRWPV